MSRPVGSLRTPVAQTLGEAVTIVGLATAPLPSGVGIIRVSGPRALELVRPLCPELAWPPCPRQAHFVRCVDDDGQLMDEGLLLYFPAPHSYTGEDVVELQLHGNPTLLSWVQGSLVRSGEARLSQPGEFTRRAFLKGRLDLTRAEAVVDLISAQSLAAVRAAAAQLRGGLGAALERVRTPLLELRADVEGVLEFPDEAEGAESGARERLVDVREQLSRLCETARRGRLLRHGARVVLFGPVNAGKSTLFNRLLGEERALVDAEPGTTRDVLEARVELSGMPVVLCDTAGLRESPGRVEALGLERGKVAREGADLAVLVVPPEAEASEVEAWLCEAGDTQVLVVEGKADVRRTAKRGRLAVSGLTGEGVEALRQELAAQLGGGGATEAQAALSERHRDALQRALAHVVQAEHALAVSTLEVVSGELGLALEAMGEVSGESASTELLDAIFRRFCIGK